MTPDETTIGRLSGFVAQAARTTKRARGWCPDPWHRALVDDADLGWALARRDATCARNRVRAVIARHYKRLDEVPQHVEAALRYLGVSLDPPERAA